MGQFSVIISGPPGSILSATQHNILLAEPDPNASCLKKVVQFLGSRLSVIPSMAEEDITEIRPLPG